MRVMLNLITILYHQMTREWGRTARAAPCYEVAAAPMESGCNACLAAVCVCTCLAVYKPALLLRGVPALSVLALSQCEGFAVWGICFVSV